MSHDVQAAQAASAQIPSVVHVSVPATSANLGPGFDVAGLALGMHDDIEFERLPEGETRIEIHGEGEDTLPRDASHLMVRAYDQACVAFGFPHTGIRIDATNRIPQARGMGSSASAITAGVTAAAALNGQAIEGAVRDRVFDIAARIEGHPDNVAPAVYGNMTVSWNFKAAEEVPSREADAPGVLCADGSGARFPGESTVFASGYHTHVYPVSERIHAWIFVPDYELSTERARQALPAQVPYSDALLNVSRVALLPAVLGGDCGDDTNAVLFSATADKLHQSYRASLMEPSAALMGRLRAFGYASMISGAGPCVICLHDGDASDSIAAVIAESLESGHWRMIHLPIDTQGVNATVVR
ncbi:MAG: homoserine kinase [Bifidobacteriaceae bacterium]|nr:homoserine kinase [Bifidobacteriaceae bacterium]